MVHGHTFLLDKAKDVLNENRRNGFTIPTAKLYPFQWNWDSAFISMGLACYDVDSALAELESLASGQWDNGMIPHIVFHSEDETSYFPNWDYWDANVNPGAPGSPKTSGISQPPVIAIALHRIYAQHYRQPDVVGRINRLYDCAVDFQRFWYEKRDPFNEGLVSIIHPWESGRDNSPAWDPALNTIDLQSVQLPKYRRRDVTIADADERPTDRQYDQYVYLMKLAHKYGYDGSGIFSESEFIVQDCMINALLIRSNVALIELGKALGKDISRLEAWNARSSVAFNRKLWDDDLEIYCSYDLKAGALIRMKEVGGFVAMYSGCCPKERTVAMSGQLKQFRDNGFLLVPSFDPGAKGFDPRRYWKGPVWPQMNWLIYSGLMENGYDVLASSVRKDLIDLISAFGFREYFDPRREVLQNGEGGYGGDHFSWTASTYIDLTHGI